ncbi:hypothetical protein BZA77DRAFT_88606 [Pyronema omphalodes]|nr:hypothetical protein BZA77DRAFT_88606 [Pyronema omphalodes]
MFIGGLNWETTDDSLKEYFSQFGEVTECTVMRDGPSGRSRGFGFLTFKDPKTVNIVMVKEHYLDGKIIDPKRAIPRDEQEKTSKIFVGGVSQEATESDFREYFTQFGRVLDATLMMDKDTGRPRGFGFVTFDSESAVENALSCPTLEIMGKAIEVKKAQPRGNTRERMNANLDERDFRDRSSRDRFEDNGNRGYNNQNGGNHNGGNSQAGAYNGMTPQMMAQYWQQMQRYMQAMSTFGRAAAGPMPIINPAMMGQAMANMPQQMAGMNPQMMQQMNMVAAQQQMMQQQQQQMQGRGPNQQSPPMQSPPQQMAVPQQQQQQQQGYNQNNQGYNNQGYDNSGYDMSQQQQQQTNFRNNRFQNHPSQRDYQPPQSHPSSWEGMYDDVPPQQVVAQLQQQNAQAAQQQQQSRGGTPNGQYGRFEGPPPNAPTGPRNTKPGSNYRGGRGGAGPVGRGGAQGYNNMRGFHPYARNQERFS